MIESDWGSYFTRVLKEGFSEKGAVETKGEMIPSLGEAGTEALPWEGVMCA